MIPFIASIRLILLSLFTFGILRVFTHGGTAIQKEPNGVALGSKSISQPTRTPRTFVPVNKDTLVNEIMSEPTQDAPTLSPDTQQLDRIMHPQTRPQMTYHPMQVTDDLSDFGHDSFNLTIQGMHYDYLFIPNMVKPKMYKLGDKPTIVFGILSTATNVQARQAIRNTWASKEDSKFFILAGNLTSHIIKQEMREFHDILYLNAPEDYRDGLTRKTMAAIQFYHHHYNARCSHGAKHDGTTISCYDYFFKTDDDTYVNATRIRDELSADDPETHEPILYFGEPGSVVRPNRDPQSKYYLSYEEYPARRFPMYAHGMGYAMSSQFASCACTRMFTVRKQPPWEDVAVGALARKCQLKMTRSEWQLSEGIYWKSDKLRRSGNSFSLLHHIHNSDGMKLVHKNLPLPL